MDKKKECFNALLFSLQLSSDFWLFIANLNFSTNIYKNFKTTLW